METAINTITIPEEFIIGSKFHYPVDTFGISVDYELVNINSEESERVYEFRPLSESYIWKGKKYSFGKFLLKRKDVIDLLLKKIWIIIK